MTEIYLHIVARMADYMDTHPYIAKSAAEGRVPKRNSCPASKWSPSSLQSLSKLFSICGPVTSLLPTIPSRPTCLCPCIRAPCAAINLVHIRMRGGNEGNTEDIAAGHQPCTYRSPKSLPDLLTAAMPAAKLADDEPMPKPASSISYVQR